jgi:hypothetical protein
MVPGQINLQVSGDENTLYGQLSIGEGTSESGITAMSDNPINLMTRDNNHYIEITKDINYISDVNGFVIVPSLSSKPVGVRIKSFNGTKVSDLAWDSTNETPESPGVGGEPVEPYSNSVVEQNSPEDPPSSVIAE